MPKFFRTVADHIRNIVSGNENPDTASVYVDPDRLSIPPGHPDYDDLLQAIHVRWDQVRTVIEFDRKLIEIRFQLRKTSQNYLSPAEVTKLIHNIYELRDLATELNLGVLVAEYISLLIEYSQDANPNTQPLRKLVNRIFQKFERYSLMYDGYPRIPQNTAFATHEMHELATAEQMEVPRYHKQMAAPYSH